MRSGSLLLGDDLVLDLLVDARRDDLLRYELVLPLVGAAGDDRLGARFANALRESSSAAVALLMSMSAVLAAGAVVVAAGAGVAAGVVVVAAGFAGAVVVAAGFAGVVVVVCA